MGQRFYTQIHTWPTDFHKGDKIVYNRQGQSCQQMVFAPMYLLYGRKINLILTSRNIKNYSKWTIHLHVKAKTIKPLEVGKKISMTLAQANKYSLGYKVPNI